MMLYKKLEQSKGKYIQLERINENYKLKVAGVLDDISVDDSARIYLSIQSNDALLLTRVLYDDLIRIWDTKPNGDDYIYETK